MAEQLERKVYSPWAYTDREFEKAKINREIYEEIKDKVICVGSSPQYGHTIRRMAIVDQDYFKDLLSSSTDEQRKKELINQIALIADDGNLCFGYSFKGTLSCIDFRDEKYKNVYVIDIFTD